MNFKFLASAIFSVTLKLGIGLGVSLGLSSTAYAADVSVQIHGQILPGIYGQVQIVEPVERYERAGRYYVESVPVVYIEVPHSHRRNWRKHCHSYRACQQRVYFVDPRPVEYREYRREHRHHHGRHHGHGRSRHDHH